MIAAEEKLRKPKWNFNANEAPCDDTEILIVSDSDFDGLMNGRNIFLARSDGDLSHRIWCMGELFIFEDDIQAWCIASDLLPIPSGDAMIIETNSIAGWAVVVNNIIQHGTFCETEDEAILAFADICLHQNEDVRQIPYKTINVELSPIPLSEL